MIRGITEYLTTWKANRSLSTRPNSDLWVRLDQLNSTMEIEWLHVKAHSGIPGNEEADKLANIGAGVDLKDYSEAQNIANTNYAPGSEVKDCGVSHNLPDKLVNIGTGVEQKEGGVSPNLLAHKSPPLVCPNYSNPMPDDATDTDSQTADLMGQTDHKSTVTTEKSGRSTDRGEPCQSNGCISGIAQALILMSNQMERLTDYHSMIRNIESLFIDKLVASKNENAELKQEILQEKLNVAKKDLSAALNKIAEQNKTIAKLSEDNSCLQQKVNKANSVGIVDIKQLQGTISRLEGENKQMRTNLDAGKGRIKTLETELKLSSKELEYIQKLNKTLEGQLELKQTHLQKLEKDNCSLQDKVKQPSNEILTAKLECCVANTSSEPFTTPRKYSKGMADKTVATETSNKFTPLSSENNEGNTKTNSAPDKSVAASTALSSEENEGDTKTNPAPDKSVADNRGILFVGNSHTMGIDNRRIYIHKKCIIHTLDNKNIEGAYYYLKN